MMPLLLALLALALLTVEMLASAVAPDALSQWIGFRKAARSVPLAEAAKRGLRFELNAAPEQGDYRAAPSSLGALRPGTLVERLGLGRETQLAVGRAVIEPTGQMFLRLTADNSVLWFLSGGIATFSLEEEEGFLRLDARWLPLPFSTFLVWGVCFLLFAEGGSSMLLLLDVLAAAVVYVRASQKVRQALDELEEIVGRRVLLLAV